MNYSLTILDAITKNTFFLSKYKKQLNSSTSPMLASEKILPKQCSDFTTACEDFSQIPRVTYSEIDSKHESNPSEEALSQLTLNLKQQCLRMLVPKSIVTNQQRLYPQPLQLSPDVSTDSKKNNKKQRFSEETLTSSLPQLEDFDKDEKVEDRPVEQRTLLNGFHIENSGNFYSDTINSKVPLNVYKNFFLKPQPAPDTTIHTYGFYASDAKREDLDHIRLISTITSVNKLFRRSSILGEGTYGVVYKAIKRDTGELVALKRLRWQSPNDGIPATSVREVALLRQLDHPNIVKLNNVHYHVSSTPGRKPRLFLEFEFLELDLRKYMKMFPKRKIPLETIRYIIYRVLQALEYCHARNVIHRDIKPNNILLSIQRSGKRAANCSSLELPCSQRVRHVDEKQRHTEDVFDESPESNSNKQQCIKQCITKSNHGERCPQHSDKQLGDEQITHYESFYSAFSRTQIQKKSISKTRHNSGCLNENSNALPLVPQKTKNNVQQDNGSRLLLINEHVSLQSNSELFLLEDIRNEPGEGPNESLPVPVHSSCRNENEENDFNQPFTNTILSSNKGTTLWFPFSKEAVHLSQDGVSCHEKNDSHIKRLKRASVASYTVTNPHNDAFSLLQGKDLNCNSKRQEDAWNEEQLLKSNSKKSTKCYNNCFESRVLPQSQCGQSQRKGSQEQSIDHEFLTFLTCEEMYIERLRNLKVKLADFGLARSVPYPLRPMTHEVVTLWYRAPEILLGYENYTSAIDLWSVGCLFIELLFGRALFSGEAEIDTLFKIFQLLGTPTSSVWTDLKLLPNYTSSWPKWPKRSDRYNHFRPELDGEAKDLIDRLLSYDPQQRITASEALRHPWFETIRQTEKDNFKQSS